MCISEQNTNDKYYGIFSDWNCYYIFLLGIGDNRYDERREDASGGQLYRTQCYAWGTGCIRRPGNCRKGIRGR